MAFYRVCEICGSNLDPGERCDCERERAERERHYIDQERHNPKSRQYSFMWELEEMTYGNDKLAV